MINHIIKTNGRKVKFDPEKANRWAEFAGAKGVSWSEAVLDAYRRCFDGCTTADFHQAMIDSCVDKKTAEYSAMAGRLLLGQIYKEAFGGFTKIPTLSKFYAKMVKENLWQEMEYSKDEVESIGEMLDHSKDLGYGYAVLKQFKDKYGIKNIHTGKLYESPQFMFIGMAMTVMQKQPADRRLNDIKKLYTYLSDLKINAPTPYLNGLRSKLSGYASCCLIKGNDTARSIGIAEHIAYEMTCKQAGIGMYLETRSIEDGVRNNTIRHQGKLPYYRCVDAAVKANRQQSRGGSATVSYLSLDPEIEDLLALNHPTTIASKQIKFMDYSIGVNKSFARRVAKNEDWILVSYKDAPELHNAMFGPSDEFDKVFDQVMEKDCKKTVVKARDIAVLALTNRFESGRIYIYWTDEANTHTPFKDTIYQSNLCQEILLPTQGYEHMLELYGDAPTKGEIALCFLSSIVVGRVTEEEYEDVAYYTVLMIDQVMDIMEYPFEQLKKTAQARRSIGVGITNLAHYLAERGVNYSSEDGKRAIHEIAELHSFSLHRASLRLAKEKGVAEWIDRTKYPEGWLPIDTYNRNVDNVVDGTLKYDWETLRQEIIDNGGIRNSVLEAFMPNESSSLATNTTNGIYPIREPMIFKKSESGTVLFIAPEWEKLKEIYQLAWDTPTKDLIDDYAIIQKFCGQTISSDFYVDFSTIPGGKLSQKEMLGNFLYATKMGMKSHYYQNSKFGAVKNMNEIACETCAL